MIQFENVTKMYPKTEKAALNGVNLDISKGEFVFLVGLSGSGKSTFLRLVLREERPTTGVIHVAGKDLSTLAAHKVPELRRQVGTVFQDFRLLPNKTVSENVAFTLHVLGYSNKQISREVPEVLQLVGLSGSGKSTFLRLVLREERPTTGVIHVAGKDLSTLAAHKVPELRRQVGTVFQDFRLLPNKTVSENVAFTLHVLGYSNKQISREVPEVLELVGLEEKGDRKPNELSGGEQQRVAIARAYVSRPTILIADEPTGNLDPATSVGIMKLLDRINREGTTVVMATHDAGIVDQMRKRVIELEGGHVIRDQARGVYGYTG